MYLHVIPAEKFSLVSVAKISYNTELRENTRFRGMYAHAYM